MRLNDTKIRGLPVAGKTQKHSDGEGLFLVVRSTGAKFWQLRYRYLDREKTLSLGKYPMVSLAEARDKKIDALRLLGEGFDPSARRKEEKTLAVFRDRNSFGSVAKEWLARNEGVWTPRHWERTSRRLDNHILPSLGNRPVSEILPLELLSVIQAVEAAGAGYSAHRCLQLCRRIFNFAIITGRTQQNIALGLSEALRPHREEHYATLPLNELPDFLDALRRLQTTNQNRIAFLLLLLTALRTGELRKSKWEQIDWQRRQWKLPPEMTKMRRPHLVPLSSQAIQLLSRLRDLSLSSEYLFPNQQGARHPTMSENTINHMIQRMGYQGRIVGHGFRSMFSTACNEHGFHPDAVERQLAHQERNRVRAAYNRAEHLGERCEMMQWWANFIEAKIDRSIVAATSKDSEFLPGA